MFHAGEIGMLLRAVEKRDVDRPCDKFWNELRGTLILVRREEIEETWER